MKIQRRCFSTACVIAALAFGASPAHADNASQYGGRHIAIETGDVVGDADIQSSGRIRIHLKDQGRDAPKDQGAAIIYDPETGRVALSANLVRRNGEDPITHRSVEMPFVERFKGTVLPRLSPTQLVQHLKLDDGETWYRMRYGEAKPHGLESIDHPPVRQRDDHDFHPDRVKPSAMGIGARVKRLLFRK